MAEAELRPYEPTWRDWLAGKLMGDTRASPERQAFVGGLLGSTGLGTTQGSVSDFLPQGILFAGQEMMRAQEAGNKADALMNAMALIPGARIPAKGAISLAKGASNEVAQAIRSTSDLMPTPQNLDELRSIISDKYPNVKLDLSGKESGPVVINRIVVPPEQRGQGIGSAVMDEILSYADKQGKVAALTPDSSLGTAKGKLIDWYSNMGFKINKGRSRDNSISELMVRAPQRVDE